MTYIVILMSFQTISSINYALENIVNSYSATCNTVFIYV